MTKTLYCLALIISFCSFLSINKIKPKLPAEYVLIPAGTFWDKQEGNISRHSIASFYMSKIELTNYQYREFLNEMEKDSNAVDRTKIIIDSTGWNENFSYGAPYTVNYFRHPALNSYPLVNVTHEGALMYCAWLQRKIQSDNPDFQVAVILPSRIQWTYAATCGRNNAIYPWGGNYLRDKHGKFLCNFNYVGASAIFRNPNTGKPEVIESEANDKHDFFTTRPVGTYYPNDFGLFNMSGNVAEMTDSTGFCMGGSWKDFGGDVRAASMASFSKPTCTIGFRPIITVQSAKGEKSQKPE